MDWSIDNDRPIWQQLYDQLVLRIVTGVYPMGSRIPPVRELASEAGVNPNTMQRALSHLEERGLAETHSTAGRVVCGDCSRIEAVRLELAGAHIRRYLQGMRILGYSEEEAAALAAGKE